MIRIPQAEGIDRMLEQLHLLEGAEYARHVERIARRAEFHLLEGEANIFVAGGEGDDDFTNQLNAARKAVALGYKVFILPNPKGIRTPDFIFERKGTYRIYDLKTISGKASVDNRLKESVGQTNRVILNMTTDYKAGKLARSIMRYFERYSDGIEVVVFRGNKKISITRQTVADKNFVVTFSKKYYK